MVLDISERSLDLFLAGTLERPGFPGDPSVLDDCANEARLGLDVLRSLAPSAQSRILEVGSGPGVLLAFLAQQGADVTGVEPPNEAFDDRFGTIRSALEAERPLPLLRVRADQLDTAVHGRFDLVFSVNVVEHLQPLDPNMDAIAGVLSPGGRMVHICPNYRFPYEPHLRVPLIPGAPALTGRLWRRLGEDPIWRTINWVTAKDIEAFAKRHTMTLEFRPGQFAAALARLESDPAFARRQRRVAGLATMPGVPAILRLLPPTWATPMIFELAKPTSTLR